MPTLKDARIKVDTSTLVNKAVETSRSISKMENSLARLDTIIKRTSYYWIGEAGERHREIYNGEKSEVNAMMARLREHPKDLLEMANVYNLAEKEIQQVSKGLPGDLIS
jgi:uncharacterized protein YukE